MAAIWIVEDDPKIGLLIEMTVRKTGHAAVRMPDAVALERALKKQVPPDLLLLDLMLREKNGFAVMRNGRPGPKRAGSPSSSSRPAARSTTR